MDTTVQAFWSNVDWLEWTKTLFDLAKGISWPLAAFSMAYMFRDGIKARIPFVKEVGPGGIKIETQPLVAPNPSLLPNSPHPLKTVNNLMEQIRAQLADFVPEQREIRLVRALAEARTMAEFEFIFANIFQSQVDALRELLVGPSTVSAAQAFFAEKVAPRNAELAKWGFDNWSAYLRSQGLVTVDGDVIAISDKGIDFLTFVDQAKAGFMLAN